MRAVDQLRVATLLEGISLLALMFVAMPLKYFGRSADLSARSLRLFSRSARFSSHESSDVIRQLR